MFRSALIRKVSAGAAAAILLSLIFTVLAKPETHLGARHELFFVYLLYAGPVLILYGSAVSLLLDWLVKGSLLSWILHLTFGFLGAGIFVYMGIFSGWDGVFAGGIMAAAAAALYKGMDTLINLIM